MYRQLLFKAIKDCFQISIWNWQFKFYFSCRFAKFDNFYLIKTKKIGSEFFSRCLCNELQTKGKFLGFLVEILLFRGQLSSTFWGFGLLFALPSWYFKFNDIMLIVGWLRFRWRAYSTATHFSSQKRDIFVDLCKLKKHCMIAKLCKRLIFVTVVDTFLGISSKFGKG